MPIDIGGSSVSLLYDGDTDITNHAVITGSRFSSAANATPGDCEVVLRDMDRELTFTTGKRLRLFVDSVPLWSGFVLIGGRSNFFPAGDGREETRSRKWILRGVDNNILFDKRFLLNPDVDMYFKALPQVIEPHKDGWLIRYALAHYVDGLDDFDTTSQIDDIVVPKGGIDVGAGEGTPGRIDKRHPWVYPQMGSKLRALFDWMAPWAAAIYYIGPDDKFHYHQIQKFESPWGFSDHPNYNGITQEFGFENAFWGFRELEAEEDGTELVTDALVWGGSAFTEQGGGTVFKRVTDDAMEAVHNKWQLAEVQLGDSNYMNQKAVDQRANVIVYGNKEGHVDDAEPGSVPGEGLRGARFSQWAYTFMWHQTDVPKLGGAHRHLYPGMSVPIQLYSFDTGSGPLLKYLPLRSLSVSFPSGSPDGGAHIEFRGSFDLRNTDPTFLWHFLRRREATIQSHVLATVNDDSTEAPYGAFAQLTAVLMPGESNIYYLPYGYIPRSLSVFVDDGGGGVQLEPVVDFQEYALNIPGDPPYPPGMRDDATPADAPEFGRFTFTEAPSGTVRVMCRTLAGHKTE